MYVILNVQPPTGCSNISTLCTCCLPRPILGDISTITISQNSHMILHFLSLGARMVVPGLVVIQECRKNALLEHCIYLILTYGTGKPCMHMPTRFPIDCRSRVGQYRTRRFPAPRLCQHTERTEPYAQPMSKEGGHTCI